MNICENISSKK